jgi:hypothetical protein
MAERPWQCKSVRLIDEIEAKGQTVIRNSFEGASAAEVFLCTDYQGVPDDYDEVIPDTSGKGELVMAGDGCKFAPPNLGPLAVIAGENQMSDVVASLGLPGGHHVGFAITWGLRDNPYPPTPECTVEELCVQVADLTKRVAALEAK